MFTKPSKKKRRNFHVWHVEKSSFNSYIRELEDCIEIDRDLIEQFGKIYIIRYQPKQSKKCRFSMQGEGISIGTLENL